MSNESLSEQDFVNNLIETQKPTAIFLKNGIKLTGIITGVDEYCLFLKNMVTQMIYKHAVSTIQP
jgi:host factor-I protein